MANEEVASNAMKLIKIPVFLGVVLMACSAQAVAKLLTKMTIDESDAYIEKLSKNKTVYEEKLTALGTRLAKASHLNRDFHYNFKILEKKGINAVSLGNGSIYIYRGAMDAFKDNESYLTFILAQEIAHNVLRH